MVSLNAEIQKLIDGKKISEEDIDLLELTEIIKSAKEKTFPFKKSDPNAFSGKKSKNKKLRPYKHLEQLDEINSSYNVNHGLSTEEERSLHILKKNI